jgi:hypothetical protein
VSSPVPPGSSDFAGRPSGPPALDGLYRAGLFDDPTERIPRTVPADRPRRGRWAVVAVVVALLALVAAGGSAWFSWQALDHADAATTIARRPLLAGATAQTVPAGPAAPTDAPAAESPTAFEVGYEAQPMRFQIGCSASLYIDLDEPRVNVDDEHSDLRYVSTCGTNPPSLALGAGADAGSQVTTDTRTAEDCTEQIRTSPLGPRATVPVQAGLMLCVLTSLADARARGDSRHLVLLTVTGLAGNATASLTVTSWDAGQ